MTVTPFEVFVRLLIIAVLIMIALVGGDGTTDVEPARPLTLKNMRELGVQHLLASCLNGRRPQALIDCRCIPTETEVPCSKPG
jgi:hypothetical protein